MMPSVMPFETGFKSFYSTGIVPRIGFQGLAGGRNPAIAAQTAGVTQRQSLFPFQHAAVRVKRHPGIHQRAGVELDGCVGHRGRVFGGAFTRWRDLR